MWKLIISDTINHFPKPQQTYWIMFFYRIITLDGIHRFYAIIPPLPINFE